MDDRRLFRHTPTGQIFLVEQAGGDVQKAWGPLSADEQQMLRDSPETFTTGEPTIAAGTVDDLGLFEKEQEFAPLELAGASAGGSDRG